MIPVAALLFLLAALPAFAELDVPATIDLGAIGDERPVSRTFAVRNNGPGSLSVTLVSSCSCLSVKPAALKLRPGGAATVRLTLDPAGSAGPVGKLLLARVEEASGLDRLVTVTATVKPSDPAAALAALECEWCKKLSRDLRRQVELSDRLARGSILYYYSPDCPPCTRFLVEELPLLERRLGRRIDVVPVDIAAGGALAELDVLLARRKLALTALPVVVTADAVLQGERDIRAKLESALAKKATP